MAHSEPPATGLEETCFQQPDSALVFDHVSRHFDKVKAVDGISLSVCRKEIVCLLGESGCGKSTLLRLAAGIERVSGGFVIIDGQEVSSVSLLTPPEKRQVGLVFQDFALFPHMTILQNVMFGLQGLREADRRNRAREALERVRLWAYADVYPHTLSGGQQQRAAIARAVAPLPKILLFDEPFSGLDTALREKVRDETLSVLRETGAASIIVTHDPEEALYLGDRIALIRNGKLEQLGTGEELYQSPQNPYVAGFFGRLNGFESRVSNGYANTPLGCFPALGYENDTLVNVFIRQEGVHVKVADSDGACGHIIEQRFVGAKRIISVKVEGQQTPLRLQIPAHQSLISPCISFNVEPSAVLIFNATTNN